jgi:hypothetical protein
MDDTSNIQAETSSERKAPVASSFLDDGWSAQLQTILASPDFSSTERLSSLLRFIVEHTARGNWDRLKETVIALEVFRRPLRNGDDAVVRTAVTQLRVRLNSYYGSTGRKDHIVISIPVDNKPRAGRYRAVVKIREDFPLAG